MDSLSSWYYMNSEFQSTVPHFSPCCFTETQLLTCVHTNDLQTVSVCVCVFCCSSALTSVPHVALCFTVQLMRLHQQGADLLLQDGGGRTLVHHAVELDSEDIVKFLVDNGK